MRKNPKYYVHANSKIQRLKIKLAMYAYGIIQVFVKTKFSIVATIFYFFILFIEKILCNG